MAAYDPSTGNLSSKGGQTLSYGDANHKHAATAWNGWTYTYDANGNMITRTYGGTTYTLSYDAENRMTRVSGGGVNATFVYNSKLGYCRCYSSPPEYKAAGNRTMG